MSSTITIPSKWKDKPWVPETSLSFHFLGKLHHITLSEVDDIERSGRSSWQDYADTPDIQEKGETASRLLALMETRPGKVKPMDVALLNQQSRSPYNLGNLGEIHYRPSRVTACHKYSNKGFGAARFASFVDHPRVCSVCLNHFLNR